MFEVVGALEVSAFPRPHEASPRLFARIAARERQLQRESHPVTDGQRPEIRKLRGGGRAERGSLFARHVPDLPGEVSYGNSAPIPPCPNTFSGPTNDWHCPA